MGDDSNDNAPQLNEELIAQMKQAFAGFLSGNPGTELLRRTELPGAPICISRPWGENAMVFKIENNFDEFARHINELYLPSRLSAILHKDTKSLEVIWTAYKLAPTINDIEQRKFSFRYQGHEYPCEFGPASERLMAIAASHLPVGLSETGYRNLGSFKRYLVELDKSAESSPFGRPLSFWVGSVDCSDDELVDMLSHLNFYIRYYDTKSPFVLIHTPAPSSGVSERVRFRHAGFPGAINARQIDPQLLQFWSACAHADSAGRFLYSFRIIEHAAFFFVENAPKQAVKRVLNSPHVLDDIDRVTQEVIAAVQKAKMDDFAKFENVLLHSVDPEILWSEIEMNIEYFSKEIVFDGDFRLKPLVAGANSKPDFVTSGIRNFCNLSRKLRNALSHGKEERSAAVITPTSSNYERLGPWANLMQVAAGEVILHNDI